MFRPFGALLAKAIHRLVAPRHESPPPASVELRRQSVAFAHTVCMIAKRGGSAMGTTRRAACKAHAGQAISDGNDFEKKGREAEQVSEHMQDADAQKSESFLIVKSIEKMEEKDCKASDDETQDGMRIHINTLSGKTITIDATLNATIGDSITMSK